MGNNVLPIGRLKYGCNKVTSYKIHILVDSEVYIYFTMKVFNLEEGAVIRPLPKIKLALSDPSHFPHLVQLLLPLTPHWSSEWHSCCTLCWRTTPGCPRYTWSGAFLSWSTWTTIFCPSLRGPAVCLESPQGGQGWGPTGEGGPTLYLMGCFFFILM